MNSTLRVGRRTMAGVACPVWRGRGRTLTPSTPHPSMKDDLTLLVCIADRSGSMEAIRDDAIGGFNAFLDAQRAEPGEARLTFVQFDGQYEVLFDDMALAHVPPLTRETFVPRGATALFDALGRTLDTVGERLAATPEAERPAKVVVVVVTDGQENASRTYTREQVFARITHQRSVYGWEFVFLAANQDAIAGAVALGMDAADGVAFSLRSALDVRESYAALSASTSERRRRR